MTCQSCKFDNPSASRFCEQCGTPLELKCSRCRATVSAGARFCGACGNQLATPDAASPEPSSAKPRATSVRTPDAFVPDVPGHLAEKILSGRAALEGERRQVTVMFGDLANYTALSEKLDPEEVHHIVQRCFELVSAEIHRFEGTINQYGGDGFMALFGAPIAHEDAARRAVHAALAIQRALKSFGKDLEQTSGLVVQMRIALNTGIVVVGRITDDLHMDYTAIGDTINLASRLQSAARPTSAVISETTHRAIEGFFDTVDLGELQIRGHAAVRAFEVTGSRSRRTRLEVTAERGLTPLVGRERELAVLEDLFREVREGRGQVVFIQGEAGIGKSRLLLEFRRRLEASSSDPTTWLEGRCVSFGQSIPMLPLIDQLHETFGIREGDGEPELIAKVEQGMRAMGGLEAETSYVRYLFSADPGDPAVAAMDASARRNRLFDALRALMLRGATLRPLVLVFEDLHWIDTSTREYLDFAMDSVAGARAMIILTHRLGQMHPFPSRSFHTTLNLHHLSVAQALEMATQVLGATDFPEELKTALEQKAEGVPLFVEEMTKSLVELGFLARENGHYRVTKALEDLSVPNTMQDIIMARLDRLSSDGKRMVQLASVIGRQFAVRLLERLAGLTGKLEGVLAELKALEIIYEQWLLAEPGYVFKHAVIQDVAYGSLLVQSRKDLHRGVGEAIEELYRDRLTEHFGKLAHHFTRGEDWSKAMQYSKLAGDQAAHVFANVEAKKHYLSALDSAAKLSSPPDWEAVLTLHSKYAEVLLNLSEYDDAAAEYLKALELARRAGDRRREMEAMVWLSSVYDFSHRGEPAIDYNEHALAIARELDDREYQAICLANRVLLRTAGWGQIVETTPDAEEALRLSKEIKNQPLLARSLVFLGGALQWRGEFDRGLVHLKEGVELAQKIHSGINYGYGVFQIGNAHLSLGNYEEALRWYKRLSDYGSAAGDKVWIARVPNLIGAVHLELYDLDVAAERNLEAYEIARKVQPWPEPCGHSLLKVGLAHLEKGEHGKAEEYLQRAWNLLEEDTWYRWRWHIPLLRARGALALAERRFDDAWKFAVESLEMASHSDSRKHITRGRRLQGMVLAAKGRLEDAAGTLESAVTLAEQIGTQPDVWVAKCSLGQVLLKLRRDRGAEEQFTGALRTLEAIANNLHTPSLKKALLASQPVAELYSALDRRPPIAT
jgi:class 3 adenylate cyclase/tetratricopeptide (TPR) repeat protein